MKRTIEDLRGVIAVPPLARREDRARTIDHAGTRGLLERIAEAGITRFMFGGNAFFYHLTLREYAATVEWMTGLPDEWWLLPAAGPGFGRLMDQAEILRGKGFPAAMLLPCSDPRDAVGWERGVREFVEAAETPAIVYLKSEDTLGANMGAGQKALARLCEEKLCVGIKYAIVREDPREDACLRALLDMVDRRLVVSGIGERPAVVHMRDWGLPGFTTGSGCVAPRLTQQMYEACARGDWAEAEAIRERFLPLEDCRDAWNPAKVLHHAVALAGMAKTGPVSPFLSELDEEKLAKIEAALGPLRTGS